MEDELVVADVHRLPDGSLPIGADLVARGWKPSMPSLRTPNGRCTVCGKPGGNCTHQDHVRGELMAQNTPPPRRKPVRTRVNPDRAEHEEQTSATQTVDTAPPAALSEHAREHGLFLDTSTMPAAAPQAHDNEQVPVQEDGVTVLDEDATAPLSRTARERLRTPTGWSGLFPEDEVYQSPFDDPNRPRDGYFVLPGGNADGVAVTLHPTNDNVCRIDEEVYDVLWRRGTKKPIYKLRYPKGAVMTRSLVR